MPTWKKNIFVNAVKYRMETEGKTAEEILGDYVALTEAEKAEILSAI
ncbi:hypothetical protein LY28_00009 [Ruminiclostridium sufflavum DSM 19573]|uniref:XkdX-like protein n=1 Tax=Ruminiclostridium sufflavum DSM 19573 TaxID=1121337 RepID=A0A318XR71_9FIRM|nr:hypothetical protein [Ruminiclostridium sufflavum]PYG90129.1 hypothetical protein LY28_00009 [Ruminiclostridium sufflavum DSM 19573]